MDKELIFTVIGLIVFLTVIGIIMISFGLKPTDFFVGALVVCFVIALFQTLP